jgi:hypothetical protein
LTYVRLSSLTSSALLASVSLERLTYGLPMAQSTQSKTKKKREKMH